MIPGYCLIVKLGCRSLKNVLGLSEEDEGTQHPEGSDLVKDQIRHLIYTLLIYVAIYRW